MVKAWAEATPRERQACRLQPSHVKSTVRTNYNPNPKGGKANKAPAQYHEMKWLTHITSFANGTPMGMRHSAITNRVKDYNDGVGVFKNHTYEAALKALCELANSGNPTTDNVVQTYSYVEMLDGALQGDSEDLEGEDMN